MVTSLLKQLVYQFMKIPSSLQSAYDKWDNNQRKRRPEENEFANIFTECTKEFSTVYRSPVFVLLDAYDECLEVERVKLISHLKNFYKSGVRLYITTRTQFRGELQNSFAGAKILEIKANEIDVEIYLRDQLSTRKKNLEPKLKEMIIKTIKAGHQQWYESFLLYLLIIGFCLRLYS